MGNIRAKNFEFKEMFVAPNIREYRYAPINPKWSYFLKKLDF